MTISDKHQMTDRRQHLVFLLILCMAFLVRLWGIWNVSTTDEYNEVIEALRVCSGHLNYERWIKRFYLYILAFEYGLYFSVGWIFNVFQSPMDFAEKIVRNMEPLFIIGRFTSVIAGTITVGFLYKIGETYYNRKTAIIASLLLTFTVFHVDLSQQAKVDALLGLLVTATFYFLFRLLSSDSQGKKDFALCGFFMALAIQTKISSITLFIPLIVTLVLTYKAKKDTLRFVTYFATFFLVGFIIGNPPFLFAPLKFIVNIYNYKRVFFLPENVVPSEVIGYIAYPIFYYKSLGIILSIITILALFNSFFTLDRKKLVILVFIFPFLLMIASLTSQMDAYYLIPIIPVLYLVVGDFLDSQYTRLQSRSWLAPRTSSAFANLFLIALLFIPVKNVAAHACSLSGPNTRYIARDWIEANIPPGSKILMDSGKSINSSAPLIAESHKTLETTIRKANENISQGKIVHEMVDTNALVYYELLLKTVPEKSYDITSTMFGLNVESIDYYINNGYKYFIISQTRKDARTSYYAKKNLQEVAKFYLSLDTDKRVHLIKVIIPTVKNRGDTFLIYRLES